MKEKVKNLLEDVKCLLTVSEYRYINYEGKHDNEYYNGECHAYETVLAKLENIIK